MARIANRFKKFFRFYVAVETNLSCVVVRHYLRIGRFVILKNGFITVGLRENLIMEKQVQFKVYVHMPGEGVKPEVRRFAVEKSAGTSFAYVSTKIFDLFPKLKQMDISIMWKGNENFNY